MYYSIYFYLYDIKNVKITKINLYKKKRRAHTHTHVKKKEREEEERLRCFRNFVDLKN